MPIQLLIADDHEVVREGLRVTLQGTAVQIVGEAVDGGEAVRMASELPLDVALVDTRMPVMDGLEVLQQVKLLRPELPVLLYSTYDTAAHRSRSRELGAAGFLQKGSVRSSFFALS